MKRWVIFLIVLIAIFTLSILYINLSNNNVLLAPSEQANVRIQISNSAPTITAPPSISPVNLNPAPSTTSVAFIFTARDRNGASDLVDSSASASLSKTGEQTRTATCTFQSQSGKDKTYSCTANMQYFDASGAWDASVSIQDQSGASATAISSFTVNLLKDISIAPTTIDFPAVTQEDANVITTIPTTITNNGNFVAPVNGNLQITALNLQGETNQTEFIPAANFKADSESQSATICNSGTSLSHNSAVSLPSITIPRGPAGSNSANIIYCLTLVPANISTQSYSAIGGNSWIIGI